MFWAFISELLPWFVAMAVLIVLSGLFSASEAALFCLRWQDRRVMSTGSRAQRLAAGLLDDPDRLLSAVLFWNLVINISYFAVASVIGLRLGDHADIGGTAVIGFTVVSLLLIIFFSEMLPKSLAVLRARALAPWLGPPVVLSVRVLDPIMPVLRLANLLSQRLVWPQFRPESAMEIKDLERAIEVSTSDAELIDIEQTVLSHLVSLSSIRVEEWMRPRKHFRVFQPPVSLSDLDGQMTPSGYLFVSDSETEDVVSAVHLRDATDVPDDHLERMSVPVIYVPWCANVADAFQKMNQQRGEVAVVVNELGETIGVLTLEDILDTVFTERPSRSERLLNRDPIVSVGVGLWQVTGMTNLRRIARFFDVDVPTSRTVTVEGALHEGLEKLPVVGDACQWGPFTFSVVQSPDDGPLVVHVRVNDSGTPS